MYIWFGIALALAFSGLIEVMLGFEIPFIVLRSMLLFLLVLGMAYTYYKQEQEVSTKGVAASNPAVPSGEQIEPPEEQI